MAEIVAEEEREFTAGSGDTHYKQLQDAHETYFKDIGDVYAQMLSRQQLIQTEYARSVEAAFQTQDQEGFRTAGEAYQQALEAACSDTKAFGNYADAYAQYKASIQRMMASADMAALNFTDIGNLTQSLSAVAQTAMQLSCGQPAATNNPFE